MLFCITANYTPKAMEAMAKNPNTNRRQAAEKLMTAAGAKFGCNVLYNFRWSRCDGDL